MSLATVIAVASDSGHNFSKPTKPVINLIAGFGVEGDAHAGKTVQHLWDKKRTPDIGENIVTRGIDLLNLPLGTQLEFESGALIELTGLRNPCRKLNKIQDGLIHKFVYKSDEGTRAVRAWALLQAWRLTCGPADHLLLSRRNRSQRL